MTSAADSAAHVDKNEPLNNRKPGPPGKGDKMGGGGPGAKGDSPGMGGMADDGSPGAEDEGGKRGNMMESMAGGMDKQGATQGFSIGGNDIVAPHDVVLMSAKGDSGATGSFVGGYSQDKMLTMVTKVDLFPSHEPIIFIDIKKGFMEENHAELQRRLKDEQRKKFKEEEMFNLDQKIVEKMREVETVLQSLPEFEAKRARIKIKIKNSFMHRTSEPPVQVPPREELNVTEIDFKDKMKSKSQKLKNFLLLLHVHPCYLIRVFNSGKVTNDDFYQYIKVLFPTKCMQNENSLHMTE